ncbi:MAG: quinone oxidoreductase [Alphaproteobacteria bacterium]
MQAITFAAPGGPDIMRLQPLRLGAPGPGEALIRHEAIGVNFIDIYHRTGFYPVALPGGLGLEAAGVVEAVGAGVEKISEGMRVAYVADKPGTYATHNLVKADRLVPLPDWLDSATAAAVLLQGLTAEYLITSSFEVMPWHTILLHAAAGGVGLLLTQWAAHHGATVIGTAGGETKTRLALHYGCAHAIDYQSEDFAERAREITGGLGVDVVYDSVGKTTFEGSLQCLKPRGTLVSFGQSSGAIPPLDVARLGALGSLTLTRPSLPHYIATPQELGRRAAHLFLMLKSGAVLLDQMTRFALADAAKAHEALEGRQTAGKVILMP